MKIFKYKKAILHVLLISAVVLFSACGKNNTQTTDKPKEDNKQMQQTGNTDKKIETTAGDVATVNLPTVQCDQCKKNLTKALKKADGVVDFDINIDGKIAKIKYDKSKTDVGKIENTITAAGYDANNKKADKDAYDNLDDCCKIPKDRKNKK